MTISQEREIKKHPAETLVLIEKLKETNIELFDAATAVRLNIAEMPQDIQESIDKNGWLTVLRAILDRRPQ